MAALASSAFPCVFFHDWVLSFFLRSVVPITSVASIASIASIVFPVDFNHRVVIAAGVDLRHSVRVNIDPFVLHFSASVVGDGDAVASHRELEPLAFVTAEAGDHLAVHANLRAAV